MANKGITSEDLMARKTRAEEAIIKAFMAAGILIAQKIGGNFGSPKQACDLAEEMLNEIKGRGWELKIDP